MQGNYMYSPIRWSKKIAKTMGQIDKLIILYPEIENVRVTKSQYKDILETIPISQRRDYVKSIPYKGKTIVECCED